MKVNWFVVVVSVLYLFASFQETTKKNYVMAVAWLCYAIANICIMIISKG